MSSGSKSPSSLMEGSPRLRVAALLKDAQCSKERARNCKLFDFVIPLNLSTCSFNVVVNVHVVVDGKSSGLRCLDVSDSHKSIFGRYWSYFLRQTLSCLLPSWPRPRRKLRFKSEFNRSPILPFNH